MYRARNSTWRKAVVRMEVEHVTKGTVTLNGRRIHRQSGGTVICESFQEAKAWLSRALNNEIDSLEEQIRKLRARLQSVTEIDEASIPLDNEPY